MVSLLILSHGIILSLCFVYLMRVTIFGRALVFCKTLEKLTTIDDGSRSHRRIATDAKRVHCHELNKEDSSKDDKGTWHTFAYLISNPIYIAQGRRVQRLGLLDQLRFGVCHVHLDVSIDLSSNNYDPPDERVRALSLANGHCVLPFINANLLVTNFNLLDVIDILYGYIKNNDIERNVVTLWIDRIIPVANTLKEIEDKLYSLVIMAIQQYIYKLPNNDRDDYSLLLLRSRLDRDENSIVTFDALRSCRNNDHGETQSFRTKNNITWFILLDDDEKT